MGMPFLHVLAYVRTGVASLSKASHSGRFLAFICIALLRLTCPHTDLPPGSPLLWTACCFLIFLLSGYLFLHSDLRLSLYSGGEGNGNPLQYSCLESPMNKGAWWATVHRVTNSRTLLSLHTHLYSGCASLSVIKCHKYPFSSPV